MTHFWTGCIYVCIDLLYEPVFIGNLLKIVLALYVLIILPFKLFTVHHSTVVILL
jgi:hypothetical protein